MTPEERTKLRNDMTPRVGVSIFFGKNYQMNFWTSWTPEQVEEEICNGSWSDKIGHLYAKLDSVPIEKNHHPETMYVRLDTITGFAITRIVKHSGIVSVTPMLPPNLKL